ncbi:MAG: hypothetical protein JXA74_17240 [Anaerolineae bacterium]|nr:hypothetical protein [Anaerolineae bacterium]
MEVRTEKITVEAAGSVTLGSAAELDASLASAGFYPPQIATASLPTASGVEGMLVYDTTANKLKFSNGTAWETITSAT